MKLTWLEISKSALLNNIAQIKKRLLPSQKFMAVVKANAYGHGLLEVAKAIENDVDYLAVFAFEDAILLRKKGITKPLLTLSRIFSDQFDLAIANNIEVTVSTFDALENLPKNLRAHICIDTGMGRDGFVLSDQKKLLEILQKKSQQIVGLYAHFASADDSAFDDYTEKQVLTLKNWRAEFEKIGLNSLVHHSASAGSFSKFAQEFDLVRIGISLYGLWPSNEVCQREKNTTNLLPVLTWKAVITEIKSLPKGSAISYGCTRILQRDSKIAVLGIGYFDGIARISSNKASAIVRGKKVAQVGRVTMNLIMLDVTDVADVAVGDVVEIIGREITADDWATWSQTSNYEVVTRINFGVKRVVVG